MEVNDELVLKLSTLARLKFEGEELIEISTDLRKMLDFIDKLNELDTNGIEPMIHVISDFNHYSIDKSKLEITKEEALKNEPTGDSDFFKVPKVLDK